MYKVCDIHAHIIPGVDDGARDLNMSMDILRKAYEQGTRSIICTSHSGYRMKEYYYNFNALKNLAHKEHIEIKLYSGCEIYCDVDLISDIIYGLNKNVIPTMNGTKYVLVEFDPYTSAEEIIYCLKNLHNNGYKTIIAHIERYAVLYQKYEIVKLLKQIGCLFQVNAYSFKDTENIQSKIFARTLLKMEYITFIGSDTHRTDYRQYAITNGINYICQNCDAEYAKDICYRNAEKILNTKKETV